MTGRQRVLRLAALLLGAAAVGGESPAAPTDADTPVATEATEPSAEAEPAPEQNPEQQSDERLPAPEVFTPSEHISEDIAVPFPVDI